MHPTFELWSGWSIPAWHLFFALSALTAYGVSQTQRRRIFPQVPAAHIDGLFLCCYVSGYFGARLLSILVEEPDVKGLWPVLSALFQLGPMTFYGGALAATAAGYAFARWRSLCPATAADLGIPAAMMALAVGRIGCFLNGDDFGRAAPVATDGSSPWWAVTFPSLGDHLARWPVQIMEAAAVFGLAIALMRWTVRIRISFRPGAVGLFGALGYANLRFWLEFLRDDFRGTILGSWVSTSQVISLAIVVIALPTLPYWVPRRSLNR